MLTFAQYGGHLKLCSDIKSYSPYFTVLSRCNCRSHHLTLSRLTLQDPNMLLENTKLQVCSMCIWYFSGLFIGRKLLREASYQQSSNSCLKKRVNGQVLASPSILPYPLDETNLISKKLGKNLIDGKGIFVLISWVKHKED